MRVLPKSNRLKDNKSGVKTIKDTKYLMLFQSGKMVINDYSLLKKRNCIKVLKGFFYISLYNTSINIKLVRADLLE